MTYQCLFKGLVRFLEATFSTVYRQLSRLI